MKKLLFLLLVFFLCAEAYSLPILYVHKKGGIAGGFNKVTQKSKLFDLPNGGQQRGWAVICKGIGFNGCPAGILHVPPGNGLDGIDEAKSIDLWEYAVDRITQHNELTGSHAIQVQVAGETFTRVYTVTWNSVDNTSDTDCEISIDREDI